MYGFWSNEGCPKTGVTTSWRHRRLVYLYAFNSVCAQAWGRRLPAHSYNFKHFVMCFECVYNRNMRMRCGALCAWFAGNQQEYSNIAIWWIISGDKWTCRHLNGTEFFRGLNFEKKKKTNPKQSFAEKRRSTIIETVQTKYRIKNNN